MYRFLEHTADVIIEVKAENLEKLFEESAKAISDFMVFREKVENIKKRIIESSGETLEDLLVNFLTDLLSLLDSEMFIWNKCKVKIVKEHEYKIIAEVFGEKYSKEKHGYKGYIKAITYHRLEIGKEDGKYYARFIIDI